MRGKETRDKENKEQSLSYTHINKSLLYLCWSRILKYNIRNKFLFVKPDQTLTVEFT